MNSEQPPTISVTGRASIHVPPTKLILVGKVEVLGATLQLALGESSQRKEATCQWLERMGCDEVEFGQPRFPDQVEPTAQSSVRRQMAMSGMISKMAGVEPEPDVNHRSVVYVYAAKWNIAGLSPEEVLVLADRIRFELAEDSEEDSQEEEPETDPFSDPAEQLQQIMGKLHSEPKEASTYQMFLAQLSKERYQELLKAALEDARQSATAAAEVVGRPLGDIRSFHCVQTPGEREFTTNHYREMNAPVLNESPLRPAAGDQFSESPKDMQFRLQVSVTFDLLESEDGK